MNRLSLFLLNVLADVFRWLYRHSASNHRFTRSNLEELLQSEIAQPTLERIAQIRARALYRKAVLRCPAYREFLRQNSSREPWTALAELPITTKENYVRRWDIEARCYDGKIPRQGSVIDESSGSSGMPNNWVRSQAERDDIKSVLQISYRRLFKQEKRILLNCFALGPWATGMSVSMGLADAGILKSIGPDQRKLENTLTLFRNNYRYLVFGYPPFVKQFLDTTKLDLSEYHLDLVVGGEGMSEALRTYLRGTFKTVLSSYGASDLEINIGLETPLTIRLRRLCQDDPVLCTALFGRDNPPMLFQFNPLEFIIETSTEGELIFTPTRKNGAAPKIRYNLHDRGGVIPFRHLKQLLSHQSIFPHRWQEFESAFPILYVFGRSDQTVAFYGAKIYPSDLEAVILSDNLLRTRIHSFQMHRHENTDMCYHLHIDLEGREPTDPSESIAESGLDIENLRDRFFDGLCRVNQDFREVSKMFSRDSIIVTVHPFGTGTFANRDIRIKNRYIA